MPADVYITTTIRCHLVGLAIIIVQTRPVDQTKGDTNA